MAFSFFFPLLFYGHSNVPCSLACTHQIHQKKEERKEENRLLGV